MSTAALSARQSLTTSLHIRSSTLQWARYASQQSGPRTSTTFKPTPTHRKGRPKPRPSSGTFKSLPQKDLSKGTLGQFATGTELTIPQLKKTSITPKSAGTLLSYPAPGQNTPSIYGKPRNIFIEHRLTAQPTTVVRGATVKLTQKLKSAALGSSEESRYVLTGPIGCGKSTLLMQAVNWCADAGWVVLYIPRAYTIVNSSTYYAYDSKTNTYVQPIYSQRLLQRFVQASGKQLKDLTLQTDVQLERRGLRAAGTPLLELAEIGAKDTPLAPSILSHVLEQLGLQKDVPVLLAIDDFQSLFCRSRYRDAHFKPIAPFHLSAARLLLEYAGGKRAFSHGAVLGATSEANTQFNTPLELQEALGIEPKHPPNAYTTRSADLIEYTKDLQAFDVPAKLSIGEAGALFEFWRDNNALHSYANDELFLTKYAESSGNARDFVRGGLLSSLTA